MKDTDINLKNLRHQVDQNQASLDLKSQEITANQAENLQGLQLRVD